MKFSDNKRKENVPSGLFLFKIQSYKMYLVKNCNYHNPKVGLIGLIFNGLTELPMFVTKNDIFKLSF